MLSPPLTALHTSFHLPSALVTDIFLFISSGKLTPREGKSASWLGCSESAAEQSWDYNLGLLTSSLRFSPLPYRVLISFLDPFPEAILSPKVEHTHLFTQIRWKYFHGNQRQPHRMKPFPSQLVPGEAEAWEEVGTKPWVRAGPTPPEFLFASQWGISPITIRFLRLLNQCLRGQAES